MNSEDGEDKATKPIKLTEREALEQEKIKLAKKIGIWGKFEPVDNYFETDEYKKIAEIDKRLAEIING